MKSSEMSEAGDEKPQKAGTEPGPQPVTELPGRPGLRDTAKAMRHVLAPMGKRRLLTITLVPIAVGFVAMLAFTGFSFWWTSQPSFCNRCHPMKEFVQAWEVSSHKNVNCENCHTTPGLFGFIGGKIAGLQVVANYIRGDFHDYSFNAVVSNGACLSCHREILEGNVRRDGLIVSHKNIVGQGGKCMNCHSTVAHGDAVPVGSATHPTMAACVTCHNGQVAPLKCSICHEAVPSATQPKSTTTPAAAGASSEAKTARSAALGLPSTRSEGA